MAGSTTVVTLDKVGSSLVRNGTTKLLEVAISADAGGKGLTRSATDGALSLTGALIQVTAAVGDTGPVPATGIGLYWSTTSLCAVVWNGTKYLALTASAYSSGGGIYLNNGNAHIGG